MVKQIDSFFWFKINGLLRYFLAHTSTNFFPLYIINEYPKSGGTWVGNMLSEALGVPFPRNRLPMLCSSILHEHKMHSYNINNILIVWRDGRDVLVSQYYHYLFENESHNSYNVKKWRSELNFIDYNNIKENLPVFIEHVFKKRRYSRFSWSEFVNKWSGNNQYVYVKYEDLRANPTNELIRIVYELTEKKLNNDIANQIIENYSFEKLSGRKPGNENKKSFMRKGIVGDWKNHFSKESKEIFNQYAGKELIELGYEENESWL